MPMLLIVAAIADRRTAGDADRPSSSTITLHDHQPLELCRRPRPQRPQQLLYVFQDRTSGTVQMDRTGPACLQDLRHQAPRSCSSTSPRTITTSKQWPPPPWPIASTTSANGRLRLPGMWPLFRPGRGSGASPRKRSAGRASTTCAEPLQRRAHLFERGDEAFVEAWGEGARLRTRLAMFERPAFVRSTSAARPRECGPPRRRKRARSTRRAPQRTAPTRHRRRSACRRRARARSSPSPSASGFGSMCGRPGRGRRSCRCRRTPRRECGRAGIRPRRAVRRWADARSVDHAEVRVAELGGELLGRAEIAGGHGKVRSGRKRARCGRGG